MTVFKRMTKTGKLSATYHYRFQVGGRRYSGNTYLTRKDEAVAFELEKLRGIGREETVRGLFERHRERLAAGKSLAVADAWAAFAAKPRRTTLSQKRERSTQARWEDFRQYMADNHPSVVLLIQVTRLHAETYVMYVRKHGRWNKVSVYRPRGCQKLRCRTAPATQRLSANAKNDYLQTAKMVFGELSEDCSLPENPFAHIRRLNVRRDQVARRPFSPDELQQIGESIDGPLYSLFLTAICTGLDRQDICLLKKSAVTLWPEPGWIECRRGKTGSPLRIPLAIPGLRPHLLAAMGSADGEYVYPELADMYRHRQWQITTSVRQALHDLGIEDREQPTNRDRKVNVKGVHSLRHTFVYLAGLFNLPFPIVQAVAGHMTPKMTEHYMHHATDDAKIAEMSKMPNYLLGAPASAPETPPPDNWRGKARAIVAGMTAANMVEAKGQLLDLLR